MRRRCKVSCFTRSVAPSRIIGDMGCSSRAVLNDTPGRPSLLARAEARGSATASHLSITRLETSFPLIMEFIKTSSGSASGPTTAFQPRAPSRESLLSVFSSQLLLSLQPTPSTDYQ